MLILYHVNFKKAYGTVWFNALAYLYVKKYGGENNVELFEPKLMTFRKHKKV